MSTPTEALDICADIVERARAAGADEAEAYFESSTNRTVDARKGELESYHNGRGARRRGASADRRSSRLRERLGPGRIGPG